MKILTVPAVCAAFLASGIIQAADFCHPDMTEDLVKEAVKRKEAEFDGAISKMTLHSLSSRKNIWVVFVKSELESRVYEVETDDCGCEIIAIRP